MKMVKDAFELAIAAARDTEVPLWLVGDRGLITDILVLPPGESGTMPPYAYINGEPLFSPGLIPVGMHWYGKVITACDPYPCRGCNLVEKDGLWQLVDEYGCELPLDVVEEPRNGEADEEVEKE